MKKIIVVIISLLLLLSGCSISSNEKSTEIDVDKEGDAYEVVRKTIPIDTSRSIFCVSDNAHQIICICSADDMATKFHVFIADKDSFCLDDDEKVSGVELEAFVNGTPNLLFAGNENDFYLVERKGIGEDTHISLYHYNLDGEQLDCWDITEICEQSVDVHVADIFLRAGACDASGQIYIAYTGEANGCLVMEANGSIMTNIYCDENQVLDLQAVGEKVYALVQTDGGEVISQVLVTENILCELMEVPGVTGDTVITAVTENELWMSTYDGVFHLNVITKELQEVFQWPDAGIDGGKVYNIFADEDGRIGAVLYQTNKQGIARKIIYLEPAELAKKAVSEDATVIKERESFTIFCHVNGDDDLKQAVALFNMDNTEYEAEIEYYESVDELKIQLMLGKGPDLFPTDAIGAEYMVAAGIAENLFPYIDSSEVLSREMLHEKALEIYAIDGKLIGIPRAFGIFTLMGRASELGTEAGWTTQEFLDYVEAHRGSTIFEGRSGGDSREYLVAHYYWAEWEKLVDYINGEAHFDNPEFKAVLEYAKTYKALYDNEKNTTTAERVKDGKVLLVDFVISSMRDYRNWYNMFEGDIVFIGEPSSTGEPQHGIAGFDEYSINVNGTNKAGAWAFIEYLLLAEEDNIMEKNHQGFPTYLPAFEGKLAYEKEYIRTSTLDESGFVVYTPCLTEEDVCLVRELINSASYVSNGTGPAGEIVYEEVDAFLNGERDVDQTIEIIQNRVQLYLDEMK